MEKINSDQPNIGFSLPSLQDWEKWVKEFKKNNGDIPNSLETFNWYDSLMKEQIKRGNGT